jgi:hypothetical protein
MDTLRLGVSCAQQASDAGRARAAQHAIASYERSGPNPGGQGRSCARFLGEGQDLPLTLRFGMGNPGHSLRSNGLGNATVEGMIRSNINVPARLR